jgi:SAM-dependent methyltransferase
VASLPITAPGSWVFSGDVPSVFVDHARHSVPLYDAGHDLVCNLSTCFLGGDVPRVGYELGSATGQLLRRLATYGPANSATHWIGVDREAAMVEVAREHCADLGNVEVIEGDLATLDYQSCDIVIAYRPPWRCGGPSRRSSPAPRLEACGPATPTSAAAFAWLEHAQAQSQGSPTGAFAYVGQVWFGYTVASPRLFAAERARRRPSRCVGCSRNR